MQNTPTGMIVHSRDPFNAEPKLSLLRRAFVTPQALFYVRSHGDIPRLQVSHRVSVDGMVASRIDLSLPALQARFPPRSVAAVLQCAGNRRADMQQVRSRHPAIRGRPAPSAMPNGQGCRSPTCCVRPARRAAPGLHVAFERHATRSTCRDAGAFTYGASIPLEKALTPGRPARLRDER